MAAPPPKDPWPVPPPWYQLFAPESIVPPPAPPPLPAPDERLIVLGMMTAQNDPLTPEFKSQMLYRTRPDGSIDHKAELARLNQELLFLVLELLKTLCDNPEGYPAQLSLINTVLSNMQHLINCLRPHQARATLEHALQQQVELCKSSISRLRTQRAAVDDVMRLLADSLGTDAPGDAAAGPAGMDTS